MTGFRLLVDGALGQSQWAAIDRLSPRYRVSCFDAFARHPASILLGGRNVGSPRVQRKRRFQATYLSAGDDGIGPRQEFIDAAVGMAVDDLVITGLTSLVANKAA